LEDKPPVVDAPIREPEDITDLRHAVADLAREAGMEPERVQDFAVCLGEAATNALVHGRGGNATVYCDDETFWIRVVDRGPGIATTELPRATLVKGYSTIPSLGMGFSIMLELADSVRLCTGEAGTQLLLEMSIHAPKAAGLDLALLSLDLDSTW